ncbi:class I SAM-dependent methyltransferase [Streptomyces noursei]|uniref:class I SAM-dependent methyltransferase n=1 Tax=Streptomyces noursei TaxID=1971 RepID=UPI0016744A39|nr:class I SAM-dependent methyltransferase [Streptomyces noursei]MCZ1014083.1 class I SAM-dependent methyltransferase [Streptomyces noursei]GGX54275.1 hypothetical protein GCM10010341_89270 [Streptomyces noursei]
MSDQVAPARPEGIAGRSGLWQRLRSVDGPWEVTALGVVSVLCWTTAALAPAGAWRLVPAAGGAFFFVGVACFLYSSLSGKQAVWDDLIDQLAMQGSEHVLDVGCGRGAVLTTAARRLTDGRAVGIDLWRQRDQAGNSALAAWDAARAAHVAERTEFLTADMTELPFGDATFDVVLTSMAVHNVHPLSLRRRAIAETVRVLKPGGMLIMLDIKVRGRVRQLTSLGMCSVTSRSAGPRMWWLGPLVRTTVITARKSPATGHLANAMMSQPVTATEY